MRAHFQALVLLLLLGGGIIPSILSRIGAVVRAQRNVSVDDTDPSIQYRPAGAWTVSANSTLDYGGAHMLTQNPNATATFNFTGVAIYFLSPLWPYLVNTALSLDGGSTTLVDLVDHSRPDNGGSGPETVQYSVVWSAVNLNNTAHTLLVSVGAGQPFAIVDGLIYSTLDAPSGNSSTVASSPTPSASSGSNTLPASTGGTDTPSPAPSSTLDTQPSETGAAGSSSVNTHTPIAVGTVLGIFGLLVILLFIWFCVRKRRRRPFSEAWTFPRAPTTPSSSVAKFRRGPPASSRRESLGPSPLSMSPVLGSQYPYNSASVKGKEKEDDGAWQNPRFGYVGMPLPAIPSSAGASMSLSREPYATKGYYGDRSNDVEEDRAYGSYSRAAAAVIGGEYVPPGHVPFGSSPPLEPQEAALVPPNPIEALGHSPGRYTPGVALSTITEASPTVTERSSQKSSLDASLRSDSPSSFALQGKGLLLHESSFGQLSPTGGPSASALSSRPMLQRARPPIRSGSLLSQEVASSDEYPSPF